MPNITITAQPPAAGGSQFHVDDGVDFDVEIKIDTDDAQTFGITLVPDPYPYTSPRGELDVWGSVDSWIDGDGARFLRLVDSDARFDITRAIVSAAREARDSDRTATRTLELDLELFFPVESLAEDSVEDDVLALWRDGAGRDDVAATLAPGHVGWDEPARNAGVARRGGIPQVLAGIYWRAYARIGREIAAALVADGGAS